MVSIWRGRRDPAAGRFPTLASLIWVIRHRAWTPWRRHEGSRRIGEKVVLGRQTTVNCYLDVEIGAATNGAPAGARRRRAAGALMTMCAHPGRPNTFPVGISGRASVRGLSARARAYT